MTNAGWYPDPAGAPDTYRYWDGQAWSQMTTTQPSGGGAASSAPATPPAPPATPPAPEVPPTAATALPPAQPAYQQQPYQQQPYQPQYQQQPQPAWSPTPPPGGTGGTGSGSTGKTVGIVVAAVLVLALLGVGGFFGIRALSGDDDGDGGDKKADDPTSQTSDGPTDETSSTVRPTGIQCTGGKPEPTSEPDPKASSFTSGGLTIPKVDGYQLDVDQSPAHTFADNLVPQTKEVVPKTWIAEYAVGAIPRAHGFEGIDSTAEIIMQCITTNDQMYRGFQSRTDLKHEEITVDGRPAYRVTSELRVKQAGLPYEGDVTTVIVVDTGDPASYGLFIGLVPIGDQALGAQAEQTIAAITVD